MHNKRFLITLLVLSLLLLAPWPTLAQPGGYPLENCLKAAFSTEEDFMMTEGEPYDGNPYISDGDLLSPNGQLCARNADLLLAFSPTGALMPDLGLDAVDILSFDDRLVAFSTELDDTSPNGPTFTAGDLLITNGAIIPNAALVLPFEITHDIGLDAVQFMGKRDAILRFVDFAAQLAPDDWLNGQLQEQLANFNIDIWFSIEGTQWFGQSPILDGDALSAAGGTIVASNADLLRIDVPAGLPNRGVDFGLDALVAPRSLDPDQASARQIHFSTEILYRGQRFSFNDGDILLYGNGIIIQHEALINAWNPAADFLGLDAFWGPIEGEPPGDPNIQTLCGDRPAVDFDGGMAPVGGPGSGLYKANFASSPPGDPPRRPCGEYVPIDGFLPSSGVNRFRVVYRLASDPIPPAPPGIRTDWILYEWHGFPHFACLPTGSLNTDADGWLDATTYLDAKSGLLTGCANSGLRLAVWDTNNHMGYGPPDKDGHYVVWLEWEDNGGTLHREPVDHHIQLDNTLPTIAAYPDGLQVRLTDEMTVVPACGEAPSGTSEFQVWGQFEDDYYWYFELELKGGLPPNSVTYGPHNYYDPDDGTPLVKNTDDTGTTPDATTVHLRNIDMTDLGESFQNCCYLLELWVRDAAIRHTFNKRVANDNSGSDAYKANAFVTFAAGP